LPSNALRRAADAVERRLIYDLKQINKSITLPDGTAIFVDLNPAWEKCIAHCFGQLLSVAERFRVRRPVEWAKRRITNAIRMLPEYSKLLSVVGRVYEDRFLQEILAAPDAGRSDLETDREARQRVHERVIRNPGGRPTRFPPEFVIKAGTLWREAQDKNDNVSDEALAQIGVEMDKTPYTPPAEYLEPKAAAQVKRFNSDHSHSRVGPIMNWSKLVATADKDLLRGMRKLFSRCANKLNLTMSRK
jgi:hypothetical protein